MRSATGWLSFSKAFAPAKYAPMRPICSSVRLRALSSCALLTQRRAKLNARIDVTFLSDHLDSNPAGNGAI